MSIPSGKSDYQWEWQDSTSWKAYEQSVQDEIEKAYQAKTETTKLSSGYFKDKAGYVVHLFPPSGSNNVSGDGKNDSSGSDSSGSSGTSSKTVSKSRGKVRSPKTKAFSMQQENVDTHTKRAVRRVVKSLSGTSNSSESKSDGSSEAGKDEHTTIIDEKMFVEGKEDVAKKETCSICFDGFSEVKGFTMSKCKGVHLFHKDCIMTWLKEKAQCPVCKQFVGVMTGNSPDGKMTVSKAPGALPGHDKYGTITINWNIPNGIQSASHPHPGQAFTGTNRVAYLPDSPEGNEVLRLIHIAWKRKLIFTVGKSITTGQDNVVIWSGVHFKTSQTGGIESWGYPDETYLARVTEELASKGVT